MKLQLESTWGLSHVKSQRDSLQDGFFTHVSSKSVRPCILPLSRVQQCPNFLFEAQAQGNKKQEPEVVRSLKGYAWSWHMIPSAIFCGSKYSQGLPRFKVGDMEPSPLFDGGKVKEHFRRAFRDGIHNIICEAFT